MPRSFLEPTTELIAQAKEMRAAGASWGELERHFGYSPRALRRRMDPDFDAFDKARKSQYDAARMRDRRVEYGYAANRVGRPSEYDFSEDAIEARALVRQHRSATAADRAFGERMKAAIRSGQESATIGVVKTPSTTEPRCLVRGATSIRQSGSPAQACVDVA